MKTISSLLLTTSLFFFIACSAPKKNKEIQSIDQIAESYVKLSLEIGRYYGSYIDAYYGPKEWERPSSTLPTPLDSLQNVAQLLQSELISVPNTSDTLRFQFLEKQISAMNAFLAVQAGTVFSFDEESERIYDAIAPQLDTNYFLSLIQQLNELLPGKGSIPERLADFKQHFVIPVNQLDTVFKTAIKEARYRTKQYIELPKEENFTLQYVKDKEWSGYNWFKGNGYSLIQINTDFPIHIDRVVDLACHEGYPGHHVFNVLMENNLVNKNNWIEYSVYPLYSPQSLISEGTANFGITVAFPGHERADWEAENLFPMLGFDQTLARKYYQIHELVEKLDFAGNEACRGLINGTLTDKEVKEYLFKYMLYPEEKLDQRLAFLKKHRAYVINYSHGLKLTANYITMKNKGDHSGVWKEVKKLLERPLVPSKLTK